MTDSKNWRDVLVNVLRNPLGQQENYANLVRASLLRAGRMMDAVEPHTKDGQVLDSQVRAFLAMRALNPPPSVQDLSVPLARANFKERILLHQPGPCDVNVSSGPNIPGHTGELATRLYLPRTLADKHPALLFFHGGGFVYGDLDTHDAPCQLLAETSGCAVLSVAYRLAPEYPFPAAYNDAVTAWKWLLAHAEELGLDSERLAVGGDSSGGNLAASLAIAARDLGIDQPLFQLLIYPGTNLARRTRSYGLFAEGYSFTRAMSQWLQSQHQAEPKDPRISPLLVEDLSQLAPAHVVLGGFDPLRDEGLDYVRRLKEAGNTVSSRLHPGLIHGFITLTGIVYAAHEAVVTMGLALKTALHKAPTGSA